MILKIAEAVSMREGNVEDADEESGEEDGARGREN
jgi:hypothetical protein